MKNLNLRKLAGALAIAAAGLNASGTSVAAEPALGVETLNVGIANNKPWAYKDTDGQVKGVNADILRAVFEPLGVKQFNFVVGDFGSLIPGLLSKRYDVVDSGVVITPARCKLVNFGDPELTSLDALLVAKGNPKNLHSFADVIRNPDVKIGGSRGGQQTKNAATAGVTGEKLQQFQNTETTVSALLAHRVDGVVFTSGTALSLQQRPELASQIERAKPFTGLIDPKTGKETESYIGAAFGKDGVKLRDAYNTQLAKLKADGTIGKIMRKYGFADNEKAPAGLTSAKVCAE
ncbi:ectoine/hydroxyectoine ABC transporter substrate-binding protein EhuB [Chitinasiproducens palmae]|uniref:Amino acid ABC transporter substrate-binding protein, PAAT family n=1 Tax=Chitinasiproducens palmae TaxID=1770053 RepID=A0A1H2PPS6_9BURK|nr:ectoine/hydroxyectoine ABC transporter substrate-binding protein EhuB [Chitinasiproducens palmae]SDV48763.1 amino acid ABC transporter substrate-binding protein, PAAT family [Chitinasiproducens palmae]